MLHVLKGMADIELVGLLTTFNETADRVAMHAVRHDLVEAQARLAGAPLWPVPLPFPCSNSDYEARMYEALESASARGVTHMAFGDLYLEDVRDYRIAMLKGSGIEPLFPIWCGREGTDALAQSMVAAGLRAQLTCVDPKQLSPDFAGRTFDETFLADLPAGVDPCGENGEFHTFCFAGPAFTARIAVETGETVTRDGFVFTDLVGKRAR